MRKRRIVKKFSADSISGNGEKTMSIKENVLNRIENNKAITATAFLPDGNNTADEKAEASNRMSNYNKMLALTAEHLKTYALAYFSATYSNKGVASVPNKSTIDSLVNDVIELARILYITDLDRNTALYIAKCMCNVVHSFKAVDNNTKVFTADFSAKGIKRPFERALNDGLFGDYAYNIKARENAVHEREIEKLVKKCIDLAEHGKSKALNNHLDKLSHMVNAERFETLKLSIMVHFVEIVPPTGETPVLVPDSPVTIEEEKTA